VQDARPVAHPFDEDDTVRASHPRGGLQGTGNWVGVIWAIAEQTGD
jgi:hypothetical protein